ncbi:MAG TPA: serine/threonine-protein kinase [Gemmataceae bacterium]|nr:serine/threonine-protein kinase [Gemmataceae bacterium]
MRFTYRWGQRPLEGFTIKRGLGQGGFGEVYFAVSDGGKEVALKLLVRGRTDTELRGISNCLNFKHPNLVHLYDLKTDERGDHWLVMEYVHGEPLNAVLNRNPKGLPPDQARDWFLQVAHAVAYLHDHAVIHRDIKPGNVFVEHGMLKLGDYGLSKTVSANSLTQSANVGTVYYMAPEVGKGACTKHVDMYACGVMFYEMLTGEVPFRGDSWAEVALRHQTDTPVLDRVPPEYLAIIEKALNKKPENRFADMDEMIRAVETVSRIGPPVRQQEPILMATAIDERGEKKSAAVPPPLPKRLPPPLPRNGSSATLPALPSFKERLGELSTSMAMAPLASVIVVAAWALFQAIFYGKVDWFGLLPMFALTAVLSWAVLIPSKMRERRRGGAGHWTMMGFGVLVGLAAFWLEGWALPTIVSNGVAPPAEESYLAGTVRASQGTVEHLIGYTLFFALALGMTKWSDNTRRRRRERFTLGPVFVAGFCAFLLWIGWNIFIHSDDPPGYIFVALAGTAGVVQMVSPWTPPPPPQPKRRRLEYA